MSDRAGRADLVLLIGSPRSGTTWLQSMLGSHPAIATPQETDLFSVFIEPLLDAWDGQRMWEDEASAGGRVKGLPLVLTEDAFVDAVRGIVDTMVDAVQAMKPGSRVVLEKSPSHSSSVPAVVRVAPQTRFIHLIRDGRDVASSLVAAAGDGWGRNFAPTGVAQAAYRWRMRLTDARTAATAPGGYCEVRYEDLRGPNGATELARVFAQCGVKVDEAACAELLAAHGLDAMRASGQVASSILTGGAAGADARARQEPSGFYRSGGGGWRAWSANDKRAFVANAGDLLVELGYERDHAWTGVSQRHPLSQRFVQRSKRSSARALRRWADRLDPRPFASRRHRP